MITRKGFCQVQLTAAVWLLRSGDLFDYHSSYTQKTTLVLTENSAVYQVGSEITVVSPGSPAAGGKLLALVVIRKDSAVILRPPKEKLWFVIEKVQRNLRGGYQLSRGDVFRLGSASWRVTEIRGDASEDSQCETQKSVPPSDRSLLLASVSFSEDHNESPHEEGLACKICLGSDCEPGNPLISPCACRGTIQHIHVKCMDSWIGSKQRSHGSAHDVSYPSHTPVCNVCLSKLPRNLVADGKLFLNLGVPKPEGMFMVLQSTESQEMKVWQWHRQKTLKVGRGPENDVQIPDCHTSYMHAKLKTSGGEVRLSDLNSQHGSMILLRDSLPLSHREQVFQCGNAVLRLKIKKPKTWFACFGSRPVQPASEREMMSEIARVASQVCD